MFPNIDKDLLPCVARIGYRPTLNLILPSRNLGEDPVYK